MRLVADSARASFFSVDMDEVEVLLVISKAGVCGGFFFDHDGVMAFDAHGVVVGIEFCVLLFGIIHLEKRVLGGVVRSVAAHAFTQGDWFVNYW